MCSLLAYEFIRMAIDAVFRTLGRPVSRWKKEEAAGFGVVKRRPLVQTDRDSGTPVALPGIT
jgi:hypothetical protein